MAPLHLFSRPLAARAFLRLLVSNPHRVLWALESTPAMTGVLVLAKIYQLEGKMCPSSAMMSRNIDITCI